MAASGTGNIIIKKVKKVSGGGHHGGAWKVAYADFVTAMMAFFLMMWLLNATTEEQRRGIADYFNPRVPISRDSGGGESFFQGESVFASKTLARQDVGGESPPASDDTNDEINERTTEGDGISDPNGASLDPDAAEPGAAAAQADGEADADAEFEEVSEAFEALREQAEAQGLDTELLDHLSLRMTPEGLIIEIADRDGAPLFEIGSSDPSEQLRLLINVVGPLINTVENRVAIVGHTDATPFSAGSTYTNWELSADRANAARRLLADAGLPSERLSRVSGSADRDPIADDPSAPQNRRIAITLLRIEPL